MKAPFFFITSFVLLERFCTFRTRRLRIFLLRLGDRSSWWRIRRRPFLERPFLSCLLRGYISYTCVAWLYWLRFIRSCLSVTSRYIIALIWRKVKLTALSGLIFRFIFSFGLALHCFFKLRWKIAAYIQFLKPYSFKKAFYFAGRGASLFRFEKPLTLLIFVCIVVSVRFYFFRAFCKGR